VSIDMNLLITTHSQTSLKDVINQYSDRVWDVTREDYGFSLWTKIYNDDIVIEVSDQEFHELIALGLTTDGSTRYQKTYYKVYNYKYTWLSPERYKAFLKLKTKAQRV